MIKFQTNIKTGKCGRGLMSGHRFKICLHGEGEEETKKAKRARKPSFLPLLPFLLFLFPFAIQLKKPIL
jgi:hypothetical protein